MKGTIRTRFLSALLVLSMCLGILPGTVSAAEPTADDIEQAVEEKLAELYRDVWKEGDPTSSTPGQYQIYPVPQNISYPDGDAITLPATVRVAAPNTITEETKAYLKEVLGEHGLTAQFVEGTDKTADLYLGLYGDGGAAADALPSVSETHYDQTDAYALTVSNGKVAIVSKDSRGVYYGVATLNMMLSSLEGKRLVPVLIQDYASIPLRGIVEGFYGGFSEEQRREQIRFCRDVKMNIFIYASKTDPYHHEEWEQLYPNAEIAYFKELVQIGKESNVDFSWSVHTGTFFRSYNANTSATQIQQLKAKFQQMIDIGVRQFAILNDDFGSGSITDVVTVVNEMNRWLTEEKSLPPLIYCPQNYNNSWANGDGKREITGLTALDDDIMLFWTGRDVNSPFWQDSIDYVIDNTTDSTNPGSHQTPVFWVNYPCNEHAKSGLLLGSSKYYLKNDITGLGGAVANPIFFAETSKVAYFQLANYFWNVHNVEANADYVWEQSFKYLQPEVYDAYFTIARNACEAPGSTRIAGQIDESTYIAALLDDVKAAALNRTLLTDPDAYGEAITLLAELRHIQDAVDTFQRDCENEALKTELASPGSLGGEPGEGWLHALDNMSKTAEALLLAELEMCRSNPSDDIIYRNFSTATSEFSSYQGRSYLFPHGNNVRPAVKAATKRVLPFVNALMSDVESRANQIIGTIEVEIPANRIYTNISSLARMPLTIVGKEFSLRGLLDVNMQQGDYVGIKMDGIAELSQVDLEGTGLEGLTLQYSYHGDDWISITEGTLADPVLARYLRLINLSGQARTINLSRLAAVVENRKVEPKVCDTNITTLKENDWPQMLDGEETTYVWTGKNQAAGDYFTIDLGKAVPLGEIQYLTADGTPKIYYAKVSISTDNQNFTPIGTINNDGSIDPPYSKYTVNANHQTARYIRLENTQAYTAYMKLHEVYIEYDDSGRTPSELISVPAGDAPEAVMDGNLSTVFRLDGTAKTRMTVHVTDNTDVDSILLLTAGISNAEVSVEDAAGQIHALGTASNSLNRFSNLPANGIHTIYLDFPQGTPAVVNELLLTYGSQLDDVGEAVDNIYLEEGESGDSTEKVNLALKRTAEASGVEGSTSYTADLAVDGNAGTRWASQINSGDRWILVDLGEDINLISSFEISYHARVYPMQYDIQVSNDKTNWVTVKTLTNQRGFSDISNTAELDKPVSARYVRLFFGGNDNMNPDAAVEGVSIKELEVWGVRRTASMVYTGVTQPASMTVDVGGSVELPALLDATISSGMDASDVELRVLPTWTPSSINTQQEGIFDATSPLPTGRFLYNTKNLSAQVTVVVGSGGLTDSNLALNQPADTSGEELVSGQPQKASYAVDGNSNTRWSSGVMRQGNAQATDQWLSVDLGARPVLVKGMEVQFHLKVWPTEFYVEASDDNQTWVRVASRTRAASDETNITESFSFATPVSTRYWRLYFPKGTLNPNSATGATGVSVKEWTVTGDRFLDAVTYTGIGDTFADRQVENQATVADLNLPALLNVTWRTADAAEKQVQVLAQWDTQNFDQVQNKKVVITAALPTDSMHQNPQNLSASISVTKGTPPTVTGVTVTPETVQVPRGSSQQFAASVEGQPTPGQDVLWSVTGGGTGTRIDSSGLLTVAADEQAGELTVWAQSVEDGSISGAAQVTVLDPVHIHTLTYVETVDATCSSVGRAAHWYCAGCDTYYLDEQGLQPVSAETLELPVEPDNHTPDPVKKNAVAATCTESGYTGDTYCIDCKALILPGTSIDPTGHSYESQWSANAEGHWHACANCDEMQEDAPLPHQSSGPATETVAETCTVCGYIITPVIGHTHAPASDEWKYDETQHWHDCSGCNEKLDLASHNWIPYSSTPEGMVLYRCECGNTKLEQTPGFIPVASVSLSQSTLEMEAGGTPIALTAFLTPENATIQTLKWSSDRPEIASVSENGVITPLMPGTAQITVSTQDGDKRATCQVVVSAPAPTYAVVVHGSYAADTGAGQYTAGTQVSIHAGSRSGYTFAGWQSDSGVQISNQAAPDASFLMPERSVTLTALWIRNSTDSSGGGSGSGGGSAGGNQTETTTNPDGSTTTTATKPDGTVTETTKYPDGSKTVVETKPDSSTTTTITRPDGSSSVTTTDESGKWESEVKVPQQAVNAAEEQGENVTLPLPGVPNTSDRDSAPAITVQLPEGDGVTVEIPVDGVTSGTVAVLVKEDGSEEIIKTTLTTENGVTVTLSDGQRVKIVDNSKYFSDVPDSYWGAQAIDFASSRELFGGTGPNIFSPETAMTRGMMVTVLARMEGVDTFTGSIWYGAGQKWAVANDISDGTNMEQSLTREQLALMLYRYAGEPAVSGNLSGFADGASVNSWATQAVTWAVQKGLISGVGNNTLNPQGQASRAQVATILTRFLENGLW